MPDLGKQLEYAKKSSLIYLKKQYNEIDDIVFTKIWHKEDGASAVWEVEGRLKVKKGLLAGHLSMFRLQIDPRSMRVKSFDSSIDNEPSTI